MQKLRGVIKMKNPFEKHDCEYEQDVAFLKSIGDRIPTDDEWEECMNIWNRTWDRLFQLTFIEGGIRSRN
jgi:hypothetical protein